MTMTPTEASEKLKTTIKTIKTIKVCKDYGKEFLFVAFETDTPNKEIDPFYLVDKNSGKISKYNIAEDVNRFYSSAELKF